MKFGFDVHGVTNTHHRVYSAMTKALAVAGHEVHIITGHQQTPELKNELIKAGIWWTNWFSIVQYHMDLGEHEISFKGDQPWMDKEIWDRTKAEYCEREGIDLMIDDSPIYGSHFNGKCLYLLQKDPNAQEAWMSLAGRIKWKT